MIGGGAGKGWPGLGSRPLRPPVYFSPLWLSPERLMCAPVGLPKVLSVGSPASKEFPLTFTLLRLARHPLKKSALCAPLERGREEKRA